MSSTAANSAPAHSPQCLPVEKTWSVYLLLCKGDVIYTGISCDVQRRFSQHCCGKGAKFTKARPPKDLLCHAPVGSRSEALKTEYAIKQLPRAKKISFVERLMSQTKSPV